MKQYNISDIKKALVKHGFKFTKKHYTYNEFVTEANKFIETLEKRQTYIKIKIIGNKGKEGITYLVKHNISGNIYAMKTFNSKKSVKNIEKEGQLQNIAANYGLSPIVIETNTTLKYIVMEKMDYHLYDVMKKQNGNLTEQQQKDIIEIYKNLDRCKVFHADSNIMNYMYKNNKLYIIDFGMSKYIDSNLIKKLGTEHPNMKYMLIGFILKLKELNCPESSYSHLLKVCIP